MNCITNPISWVLISGCALMFPFLSYADSGAISLHEVIARALTESPSVSDIAARIAEKRALGLEKGALENPTLDSEVRFPVSYRDSEGGNEVAVVLSQPLRASDFGPRARAQELIQQAATIDEKLELLAFSQRIKLAFAKAWALMRRTEDIEKYLARMAKIEREVNRASEGGFISPGERALFKAETLKARYQMGALRSDLSRAMAELSKSAGFVVTGVLQRPEISPVPTEATLLENVSIPVKERAALAVRLAREQVKLADLDAYPTFAPKLIYERTNDYTDFVGVGISVDLPIFSRNQGARAARTAELSAAQGFDHYFSGEAFATEVKALRMSIEASTELLHGYEKEIVPTLREAVAGEEKLLTSGQGSYFRVWQTLRELSDAENEAVERTIGVFASRAELSLLTGSDF